MVCALGDLILPPEVGVWHQMSWRRLYPLPIGVRDEMYHSGYLLLSSKGDEKKKNKGEEIWYNRKPSSGCILRFFTLSDLFGHQPLLKAGTSSLILPLTNLLELPQLLHHQFFAQLTGTWWWHSCQVYSILLASMASHSQPLQELSVV